MGKIVNLHKKKQETRTMVITDELIDCIAEEYQKRDEKYKEMIFEQYLEYRISEKEKNINWHWHK